MTKRQFLTRCSAVVGGLALVAATAGFASRRDDATETIEKPTALRVMAAEARQITSFQNSRTFTGVIKAARTSELSFERVGRLIKLQASEGELVERGAILAKLDTENLEAARRELSARRDAAASLLAELRSGPRKQTIAVARAEVRDLESQTELAKMNQKRRERLLAQKTVSQEEFDDASLGLESLRAKLAAAQHRLDELESGTRQERIAAQEAVVAQLDASLDNNQVELNESVLRAPFSGTISKRHVDEGTIVSPGAPIFRIVENSVLEAWIGLPVITAARITPNQGVTILIEGKPHPARLKSLLPELDLATRTRSAIFEIAHSQAIGSRSIVPGQIARLELPDQKQVDGFLVPTSSLTRGNRGLWSVLVAEQGREHAVAVKRDVEVLYSDGQQSIVRGTLSSGDAIIVNGTHRIVAGQQVQAELVTSLASLAQTQGEK